MYDTLYIDGYWNVQLAVLIAAVWGLTGWSLSRYVSVWKQMDTKTSILMVFPFVAVPQFGIHADLPIPSNLRIALWYLFMSAGLSFWGLGVTTVFKTSNQYQESLTAAE